MGISIFQRNQMASGLEVSEFQSMRGDEHHNLMVLLNNSFTLQLGEGAAIQLSLQL
jgi:hypothetical protein